VSTIRNLLATHKQIEYRLNSTGEVVLLDGDLSKFIARIGSQFQFEAQAKYNFLATEAERFHELAQTYTPNVRLSLERLRQGGQPIRVFHQPNTLAGLNIGGLAVVADYSCELLAPHNGTRPIAVFLALDYDDAGDQRFRTPQLPAWSEVKILRLGGVVQGSLRRRVACAVPTPPKDRVMDWLLKITEAAKMWARLLRRAGASVNPYREVNEKAKQMTDVYLRYYQELASLTLANAAALSWLLNVAWELDTIVIPSSWLLKYSYKDMIFFARDEGAYSSKATAEVMTAASVLQLDILPKAINLRNKGIWRVCPQCFTRNFMRLIVEVDSTIGEWECSSCEAKGVEAIDEFQMLSSPVGDVPRLVPAVTICDLLEIKSYGLPIGIHYAGSVEHTLWSRITSILLGQLNSFEYFWEPHGIVANSIMTTALGHIHNIRQRDEEGELIDAFQRGRFPAVLYWIIGDSYQVRQSIIHSA
jgi:hypothetical protein